MGVLTPHLPPKYSPLRANGDGNQGVYLTSISEQLAKQLLKLIGEDVAPILTEAAEHQGEEVTDHDAEADRIEKLITRDDRITPTEKEAIIKARKGQGKFRDDVLTLHTKCPFTGVVNREFLKAGHLKPWCRCDNLERLDPLNGVPVTPVADHLLDKGFVSFDDSGKAVFASTLDEKEVRAMGIDPTREFRLVIHNERQLTYVRYHRQNVFRG